MGRHDERAQIERLLDAVVGGPVGLALEGMPGIGKTTLWRDAVASAHGRDYRVIATAPAEPDASLAFAGLGDLLDGLPADTFAALPDPQRSALDAALSVEQAAQAPGDPQALPRAVLGVLRELAARGPLLVAVDDEQWLDRATARVLAFALCRLRDERVCVLLARRPHSDGALWPELARGFAAEGLSARVLGPLDLGAIHDLLATQLGRPISRPQLRRIYEASGGNPLYALAIARELEGAGLEASEDHLLPLPRTLAGAIAQRLERLEPRAGEPLLVIAALASPTIAQIQAVLPDFALTDLDSAQQAGVVEIAADRARFTHPLLASTHYSRAPASRRRELHRLLAEVLDDAEARAHHLALGAEAPDRQIGMTLEQAAASASARGAPEVAAQLLEHACRLTPANAVEALRSRTLASAEQHFASGDLKRARAILEQLLEGVPSGAIRGRALLALAWIRMDDFQAAAELAEDVLVQAAGHPRISAQAHDLLAELSSNRGERATALEHARAGVRVAEQAGDLSLLARLLASEALMLFFHGAGVQQELLGRAIELEQHAQDIVSLYLPSTGLGLQLLWSDDLDGARPLLQRSLRRAAQRGEESDRVALLFHLAHLEWEAGDEQLAQSYTSEVVELSRQLANDQIESYTLWLLAHAGARHGNLDEARARASGAIDVAARIGDLFIVSFSSAILAAVELWSGRPEAAHARLPSLREKMLADGRGFVGSLTLGFWSYDIEALIALGRLDDAQAALEDLSRRAQGAANANALAIAYRCRGLLLAARGDLSGALAQMEAATAAHARRPLPLEIGRTLVEKGTLQRRAKRKAAATRSLEEALAVLEPLDAALWVSRARDELSRVGLRRATRGDGLTPAEQRVAELVATGMSNREIAGTLYMSLRTVETHLTKIYREMGIKSRAQLAASMATRSSDATQDMTAPGARNGPPS